MVDIGTKPIFLNKKLCQHYFSMGSTIRTNLRDDWFKSYHVVIAEELYRRIVYIHNFIFQMNENQG